MLSQQKEDPLRHILVQVRVTQDPQSGRVNQVNMTMHQLAERRFTTVASVCANQTLVTVVGHLTIIHRPNKNRTSLNRRGRTGSYEFLVFSFELREQRPQFAF